jgi:hypothetical protein
MKKCSKCGIIKDDSEFYKQRGKLYSSCKDCKKKVSNNNYIPSERSLKKDQTKNVQVCSCCSKEKKINKFRYRKDRGYYDTICIRCKRIKYIVRTYNVSERKAIELHNTNNCAICGDVVSGSKQHVDHNHTTGEVRGILCNNCNRAIGYFNEDINKMKNAINYLTKHG